jgi:hypothetical protein
MRRERGTSSFPAAERPRPLDGSRADEQGPQEAPRKTKIILCGQKPTFNANKVREKKAIQDQAKSFYLINILKREGTIAFHSSYPTPSTIVFKSGSLTLICTIMYCRLFLIIINHLIIASSSLWLTEHYYVTCTS